MEKIIKIFEKWIVLTLLGLMMLAVLVSTIELAVILFQELMKPPMLLLHNQRYEPQSKLRTQKGSSLRLHFNPAASCEEFFRLTRCWKSSDSS